MNHNKQLLKRMFTLSSFLVIGVLLLSACSALSFQGSVKPNSEGGVDISGGAAPVEPAQPEAAAQPAASTGWSQTTIILVVVGIAFFILILVLLITRGQSRNEPPA